MPPYGRFIGAWVTCCVTLFALAGMSGQMYGQRVLTGRVFDKTTNQPLPYATVGLRVTGRGEITDIEGRFLLAGPTQRDTLFITFLGYQSVEIPLEATAYPDPFLVRLEPESLNLSEVEVRAKKERYRRKGNPAVDLIKKVIAAKNRNQPEALPYYQFDKYEKLEAGVTNITEDFANRKLWKNYRFIFDYMDSVSFSKPVLPLYLQESLSTVYHRSAPKDRVTIQHALRVTSPDRFVSKQSLKDATERINQNVDIYSDRIRIFELDFISPIAAIAPTFYHFYLGDTIAFKSQEAVTLRFVPSNPFSFGFDGVLYIALDGSYQVLGVNMEVPVSVNLNFVKDLKLEQDFTQIDSIWVTSRDAFSANFEVNPALLGLIGSKTTYYTNHRFRPDNQVDVFTRKPAEIISPDNLVRPEVYWDSMRVVPLNAREKGIYTMIDSLLENRSFNRLVSIGKALASGHFDLGPFRIGSVYSLISYNNIEGVRTRFGLETNSKFHNHWRLGGYVAYGFGDRKVKYSTRVEYSFDPKLTIFPRHFLRLQYEDDNEFPGQFTSFLSRDNIFLSLQVGEANKMIDYRFLRLQYHKEFSASFGLDLFLEHREQRPVGQWQFETYNEEEDRIENVERIRTTTAQLSFFFAPKAKWWEGPNSRFIIPNQFPLVSVDYRVGIDGLLGGEHTFHHLVLGMRQRFFLGIAGFAFVDIQAGKLWGSGVPYPLVHIASSNQTIAFAARSFNLMNFIEFVGDEHASFMLEYHLNGLLFNQIPLVKKLKLRSIFGYKIFYGQLTTPNNPNENPGLIQFTVNEEGLPETYSISGRPYMEISAGISNIFKVFRIDYVHRLSYRDNPGIPSVFGINGAGIRVGLQLQF